MGALLAALGTKATGVALAEGISTGATLGSGISALTPTMPGIFSAAQPALAGLPAALPAAVNPGIATIFANATPALAGLPSTFAGPGLLNTMGMSPLGGLSSLVPSAAQIASPLATAGTTAGLEATKAAIIKNAMTQNAMQNAIMQNVAGGQAAQNLAGVAGSQLGGQAGNISNQMFNQLTQDFARRGVGNFPDLGKFATKNLTEIPTKTGADLLTRQAGQLPGTAEASSLAQQADAAKVYNDLAVNQARVAADAARSQKMAIEAGLESPIISGENFMTNAMNLFRNPSMEGAVDYAREHPYATAAGAYGLYNLMQPKYNPPAVDKGRIRPYEYTMEQRPEAYARAPSDSSEQRYFNTEFRELPSYAAKEGGLMALAAGGPVEQMAEANATGVNTGYPMARINSPFYSNPRVQRPEAVNATLPDGDAVVGAYSGEQKFADGGMTPWGGTTPFGLLGNRSQAAPQTSGGYNYSYDPSTNQFTQTAIPSTTTAVPATTTAENNSPFNIFGKRTLAEIISGPASSVTPTKPEVTGGIVGAPYVPERQQTYMPLPDLGPPVPYQSPTERLGLGDFYSMMDQRLRQQAGNLPITYASGGGISDLGTYSDGGRLLKGPGDGVSDSIPAVIGERQPARLADGEFVIPARIVSEIGNGSTDAGARKLYAMMDRVQKARRKTVGKGKIAANTRADKHLPA